MDGIRILDVGAMYAGPVSATLLADLGADVIKVEPRQGDGLRFFKASALMEMRGKRSIALDLAHPDGREILLELARGSDVLIENFSVGTMERLGLGPAELHEVNPRLVYVRVTGYGQVGPYAERRAMDPIGLAYAGVSHLLRNGDGVPQVTGNLFIADYLTALVAAFATAEALRRRDANPGAKGDVVDVSMYDALLRITGSEVINSTLARSQGEEAPELSTRPAPWGSFRAQDDTWVMICVVPGSDMFSRFVEAIDAHEWATDEDGRVKNELQYGARDLVNAKVTDWVGRHPGAHVVDVLSKHGIPAAAVNTPLMLADDPHLQAVGAYEEHVRDDGVGYLMPAPIPVFNGRRSKISRTQPAVGSATDEILTEIGLSDARIAELRSAGVI